MLTLRNAKLGKGEGQPVQAGEHVESHLRKQGRRLRLFFSDERMEKLEYAAKTGEQAKLLKCESRSGNAEYRWCGYSRALAVVVLLAKASGVERPKVLGHKSRSAVSRFLDDYDNGKNPFNEKCLFATAKLNHVFHSNKGNDKTDEHRWVALDSNWLVHDCIEILLVRNTGNEEITKPRELLALARAIEKQEKKWTASELETPGPGQQFTAALTQAKTDKEIQVLQSDSVPKLDSSTSKDMERDYVALARDGRYDSAASLAKRAVAGAEAAEDNRLTAHWADRVADSYRAIGLLREASAFYAMSWSKAQAALAQSPDDMSLRYQVGKTRFGQIMVDDYLMRGAFSEAYSRHAQLMRDVDSLLHDVASETLRADIRHRRIHIRRQQAEMLRYLGRYGEALKVIREVLSDYPASAHEPRSYAHLSEADSLRLQGNTKTASAIYAEVETTARERHLDGLLGAVLWRKACLLQLDDGDGQFENCLNEVAQLADDHPERYRFMVIYALLLRASGEVADAKTATGALKKAEKFGPLRPDYLVAEYAHVALCRGELLRQISGMADALPWFQKAFDCYSRMECRWGMVRAWIGVRLAGGDADFPGNVKRTLEGTDAKLFQRFERSREIEPGSLSMNIP